MKMGISIFPVGQKISVILVKTSNSVEAEAIYLGAHAFKEAGKIISDPDQKLNVRITNVHFHYIEDLEEGPQYSVHIDGEVVKSEKH